MTFYNPDSEVTQHLFRHILLVEAVMSPPTFTGKVHRPRLSKCQNPIVRTACRMRGGGIAAIKESIVCHRWDSG